MAFHQDKTLKNPKIQSRSRRKPTKKRKRNPKNRSESTNLQKNQKVQSRSSRRRPTKKSKGPKPKFETTPYKKRKRILKSKVEVEANLQKKEKEIQSKVEVEANLQKKNKSDPKSKPTERT